MSFVDTWLTGFIALSVGLVGGAIAVAQLIKRGSAGADLDMQLNDLDEQLEHMVAQLRDIEQQKDRVSESFYAEQKAHYEGKAADLMRERDVVVAQVEKLSASGVLETVEAQPTRKPKVGGAGAEVTPTIGFFAARPQLRGALWGAGIVFVVGGLFWSVTGAQTDRAPGGSITGNTQPGQGQPLQNNPPGQQSSDPRIANAMAKLKQDPSDLESLNFLTGRLLFGQAYSEAAQLNQRALAVDSQNVQARTYEAMLGAARGDGVGAKLKLAQITEKHPTAADAWFFRGMLEMQTGNRAGALEFWKNYVDVAPPSPRRERISSMLQSQPSQP